MINIIRRSCPRRAVRPRRCCVQHFHELVSFSNLSVSDRVGDAVRPYTHEPSYRHRRRRTRVARRRWESDISPILRLHRTHPSVHVGYWSTFKDGHEPDRLFSDALQRLRGRGVPGLCDLKLKRMKGSGGSMRGVRSTRTRQTVSMPRSSFAFKCEPNEYARKAVQYL